MPLLRFQCPRCARSLQVSDALAGTSMLCTGCRASIAVPTAGAAPPPMPASGLGGGSGSSASSAFGQAASFGQAAAGSPAAASFGGSAAPVSGAPVAVGNGFPGGAAYPASTARPGGMTMGAASGYADPAASASLPALPASTYGSTPLRKRTDPASPMNVGLIIAVVGGVVMLGVIIVIGFSTFGGSRGTASPTTVAAAPEATTTTASDPLALSSPVDPRERFAIPNWQPSQRRAASGTGTGAATYPGGAEGDPGDRALDSTLGPPDTSGLGSETPDGRPPLLSLTNLIKLVEPAVVRIETSNNRQGSGFVIDAQGTIITNYHVIKDAKWAKVHFHDNREARIAGIVMEAPYQDLVALRMQFTGFTPKSLRVAEALPEKGEAVASCGAPLNLAFTTSQGTVSSVRSHRELKAALVNLPAEFDDGVIWVQTTAPMSPGSSGGPIVNFRGEVIGVATMSVNGANSQNLNFAVSALDLRQAMQGASDEPRPLDPNAPADGSGDMPADPNGTTAEGETPEIEGGGIHLPTLKLPSGKLVDLHSVYASDPEAIMARLDRQAETGGVVKADYPTGNTMAYLGRRLDELNGLTLAVYEDGRPMALVSYLNNVRNGKCIIWETSIYPSLLSQYERGKKYGYTCLLHPSGKVWIMQEYDRYELRYTHFFEDDLIKSTWDHVEKGGPPTEAPYAEPLAKLVTMEETMRENEVRVKRWLRDYHREERRQLFIQQKAQSGM